MVCQTCPSCRLSVRTRFPSLPVQYCPRCLARRRRLVELGETTDAFASVGVVSRRLGLCAKIAEEFADGQHHVASRGATAI